MVVEKQIMVKKEIEIVGATLLSVEEAELIPSQERAYENWWWLRSPSDYTDYAASVGDDGVIYHLGSFVLSSIDCVRPALILRNLESSDFQVGDIFSVRGYKFKIISNHLAWLYEQDIGCHLFREDWKAADTNIYEKSDVKKYVDKWFEERIKFR